MVRLPILTLLAAAAIAGGCGGGGDGGGAEGVPPEDWAESVCGALAEWRSSLEERAGNLSSTVLQAPTPEAAKEQLGSFFTEVLAETETMIGAVDEAGRPAVDEGERIAGELGSGLASLREAVEDAAARVEAAPTDDPQAFQRELAEIGEELRAHEETLTRLRGQIEESDDLAQALDDTPACATAFEPEAG